MNACKIRCFAHIFFLINSNLMKKIVFLIAIAFSLHSNAQCIEIESILVDACDGSNEGQNEMVLFKVGSTPLNVSGLTVSWPANNWRGICQNAGTAADVATVNATIIGCGRLVEPVGGVLPAKSKVLLVCGTQWNPLAQSFASLTETITIIFQCYNVSNVAGHFANYSLSPLPLLKTLSLTFSGPNGCTDAVTYNKSLLVKQDLTIGAQDGGTVDFDPAGNATYVNRACKPPITPLNIDAGPNQSICLNSPQTFTATSTSSISNVTWSLSSTASGTFLPINSFTTTYTPSGNDVGSIKLYCIITKTCSTGSGILSTTAKDSVYLTILQPSILNMFTALPINGIKPLTVNFTNTINSATTYTWNYGNGASSNGAVPISQTYTATGVYTVVLSVTNSNGCESSQSIIITVTNEDATLVVPNVFTPNNDSINDLFYVKATNIADFNCVIFDRWGLQFYTWSDLKGGWDGKTAGKDATDGTYFFIINATDTNGKEVKRQGSFLLIR